MTIDLKGRIALVTGASRDSRAPCRKNTRPMAILVATSTTGAAAPRAGSSEASTTMPRIRTM